VTTETDLQRRIQLDLTDEHTRIWRNNVGQGWQGITFAVRNGVLVSGEARRVHYGLCPGSGDLIGIHAGRFVSLEVKSVRGRVSVEQQAFVEVVNQLRGLAGVARSVEEARIILTGDGPIR
jgi:hypothetical protein